MARRTPPKSELEVIAARLKAARLALKISPAELCRLTGIAANTYSQWESAKGRPSLDQAKLLCSNLGYTLDWIYLGDASTLPLRIAQNLDHNVVAAE